MLVQMINSTIARELGVSESQVAATVALLDEGNTVPFIARYRKEITGGLDDSQLRQLEERLAYLRELEERKQSILAAIEEQREPLCSVYEARGAIEMIVAVFESHRQGKPVSLPLENRENPLTML